MHNFKAKHATPAYSRALLRVSGVVRRKSVQLPWSRVAVTLGVVRSKLEGE